MSVKPARNAKLRLDYHDDQIAELQQVVEHCLRSIGELHELLVAWRDRPWWKRLLGLR